MARRLKSFILAAVLLAPLLAFGAAGDEARSTAPALELTLETAPVEIDGQVLFCSRFVGCHRFRPRNGRNPLGEESSKRPAMPPSRAPG